MQLSHPTSDTNETDDVKDPITPPLLKYRQTTIAQIKNFARFSGDPSVSEAVSRTFVILCYFASDLL